MSGKLGLSSNALCGMRIYEPEFLQARCLVASSAHIYTCNSSSLIYEVWICMHSIFQSLLACYSHELGLCLCLGHLFWCLTHLFCGCTLSHSACKLVCRYKGTHNLLILQMFTPFCNDNGNDTIASPLLCFCYSQHILHGVRPMSCASAIVMPLISPLHRLKPLQSSDA